VAVTEITSTRRNGKFRCGLAVFRECRFKRTGYRTYPRYRFCFPITANVAVNRTKRPTIISTDALTIHAITVKREVFRRIIKCSLLIFCRKNVNVLSAKRLLTIILWRCNYAIKKKSKYFRGELKKNRFEIFSLTPNINRM